MRVLITGASGFIGRFAVNALLEAGAEVHVVGRSPAPLTDSSRYAFHQADLLNHQALADGVRKIHATHLLHLAWYTESGRYWTDTVNLDWAVATLILMREFATAGGRRAVVAGTCAEYDWRHHTLDEFTTPLAPHTLYGQVKADLQKTLCGLGRIPDVSTAWGRVFFAFGPHERLRRLLSDLMTNLLAGREAPCSDGAQLRDFMHVADVARAFVALLQSDVEGPVNLASGVTRSVRSVVEELAVRVGRPDLPKFGALPRPAGDPPYMGASIARLRDEVGFEPKLSWDEALNDNVAWWVDQVQVQLRAS